MSSHKMLVQVFAFSILVAFGAAAETCCKNYTDTYVVSYDYQNWHQALIKCAAAGMKLATITSKDDNDNFVKFLNENNYTAGYWLGATDLGNDGYYWATTGAPVVYSNWLINQPDYSDEVENCIQWGIGNSSLTTTGWNDYSCALELLYICEKEPCCNNSCTTKPVCWCQTDSATDD